MIGPIIPLTGDVSLGWLLIESGAVLLVVSTLLICWSPDGTLQDCYPIMVMCGLVILVGIFIEDWLVGQTLVGVGAIVLLVVWMRKLCRAR
jgi:hypothetical protein